MWSSISCTEFIDIINSMLVEFYCTFWSSLIHLFKVCYDICLLIWKWICYATNWSSECTPLETEGPFSAFCVFFPFLVHKRGKYPSHFFWLEDSNIMREVWAKNKLPPKWKEIEAPCHVLVIPRKHSSTPHSFINTESWVGQGFSSCLKYLYSQLHTSIFQMAMNLEIK